MGLPTTAIRDLWRPAFVDEKAVMEKLVREANE